MSTLIFTGCDKDEEEPSVESIITLNFPRTHEGVLIEIDGALTLQIPTLAAYDFNAYDTDDVFSDENRSQAGMKVIVDKFEGGQYSYFDGSTILETDDVNKWKSKVKVPIFLHYRITTYYFDIESYDYFTEAYEDEKNFPSDVTLRREFIGETEELLESQTKIDVEMKFTEGFVAYGVYY